MAWSLRRRTPNPETVAAQERDRAEAAERERTERAVREAERQQASTVAADQKRADQEARDVRRQQAAARRRQVAGQLAAAALDWGGTDWLQRAMGICLALGMFVLYIGSYADLRATFAAFGYNPLISWLLPLGIDLPVTASVLGQILAGRWGSGWWVRVRLGILTAVMAPLTLVGNALGGAIDPQGHFTFPVTLWMDLAAFAVPGLGVVLIGWVASTMQAERNELMRKRLEGELDGTTAPAPASTDEKPEGTPAAREQIEWTLTESEAELHRQLADVERRAEAAQADAASEKAARERAAELLGFEVEAAVLLQRELASALSNLGTVQAARERAERLLASTTRAAVGGRQKAARQPTRSSARGQASDQVVQRPPSVVASNGSHDVRDAREHDDAAGRAEDSIVAREHEERPAADDLREQVAGASDGAAREQEASARGDGPEPPPDDSPRGGRRPAQRGAREQARGGPHGRATRVPAGAREQSPHGARPSRGAVEAMVANAYEQVLAERGVLASTDGLPRIDEDVAARVSESGHEITASRVRFYLAAVRQDAPDQGEPDPAAHRLRVITTQAAAPVAAAKEA